MNKWKKTEIGKIPTEAKIYPLDDCIDLIIDHRGKTPKKLGSDWVDKGIAAISAKNVHGGKLTNQKNIRYVTKEIYEKWMKDEVQKGDCLLVSEGATLGEYLYWDFDFPVVLSQRLFCIRTNPEILSPKYFYAYMTTSNFQNQLLGRASGTSVFGLRQTEVRKLQIPIIEIENQKKIGNLIYNINKKIDLLNRQNETLEEMAEVLFREWFVEKAEENWKEGTISELAEVDTGFAFKSKQYEFEGLLKVVRGKNVTLGNLRWGTDAKYWNNSTEGLEKYFLSKRDIVLGMDGSRVGRNRALVRDTDLPSILAQRVARVRAKEKDAQPFIWTILYSDDFKNYVEATHTGTSIPHISQSQILDYEILIPPTDLILKFSSLVSNFWDKMEKNSNQIATLENLRDTLLPKLMSGEVRVKY